MDKQILKDIRPVFDFVYGLLDEIDNKEKELSEVRLIAREQNKTANELFLEVNNLKKDNHALQLFIEEHCTEEDKKLIFKQSDKA